MIYKLVFNQYLQKDVEIAVIFMKKLYIYEQRPKSHLLQMQNESLKYGFSKVDLFNKTNNCLTKF